jgi:hypothetical protein
MSVKLVGRKLIALLVYQVTSIHHLAVLLAHLSALNVTVNLIVLLALKVIIYQKANVISVLQDARIAHQTLIVHHAYPHIT